MKIRGVLIIFLIIYFNVFFISSLGTQVIIKTGANRIIHIRFLDTDGKGTLENGYFVNKTNESGMTSATFYNDYENYVDISILMRDTNGNLLKFLDGESLKIFKGIKTGWVYSFDLSTDKVVPVKLGLFEESKNINNDTLNITINVSRDVSNENNSLEENESNNKEIQENETEIKEENSKISGKISQESTNQKENSLFNNYKFYIFILIITFLLIIIIFLSLALIKRRKSEKEEKINIIKYSELKEKRIEKELEEAQKKVAFAQEELKRLKEKQDKIAELEKRIEAEKKLLEKLKREF